VFRPLGGCLGVQLRVFGWMGALLHLRVVGIPPYTAAAEITQTFFVGRILRDFPVGRVYYQYCSMNASHDSLSEGLRGWRVTPPADPDFRHRVWQRIGKRAGSTWTAYLRAHATAWSLASIIVLGAAAYSGSALARSQTQADREAIVATYLVDLDPQIQAGLKP